MAIDPETRKLISSIGGHTTKARNGDPAARARQQKWQNYLDQVDPQRQLDPEERHRRALSARRADLARMSLRSVQARKQRKAEQLGLLGTEGGAA